MTVDYLLLDYIKPLGISRKQHSIIVRDYHAICKSLKEIPDLSGTLMVQKLHFRYLRMLPRVLSAEQLVKLKEIALPEPMIVEARIRGREQRRKSWLKTKERFAYLNLKADQWQPFLNARGLVSSRTRSVTEGHLINLHTLRMDVEIELMSNVLNAIQMELYRDNLKSEVRYLRDLDIGRMKHFYGDVGLTDKQADQLSMFLDFNESRKDDHGVYLSDRERWKEEKKFAESLLNTKQFGLYQKHLDKKLKEISEREKSGGTGFTVTKTVIDPKDLGWEEE